MILFVAAAHNRFAAYQRFLGDFVTPKRWGLVGTTPLWAADNGCFGSFDADQFRRMLDVIAEAPQKPRFVVVPDVVCDHRATVERFLEWSREFTQRGIPRAFVLQNGIEEHPPEFGVPWGCVDALFIGGDNAFKFSAWTAAAVHLAKGAGIWTHMGRVNSVRRLEYARRIGCDSCDGSGMARFPRNTLLPMLRSLTATQLNLL